MERRKVLVADDDEEFLLALSVRLRAEGYDVVTSSNGYGTLASASEQVPDVLILDINMPAGDGFTVHERMERIPDLRKIPVIYLTGQKSDRFKVLAKKLGAFALIYKPFNMADLLETVQAASNIPQDAA